MSRAIRLAFVLLAVTLLAGGAAQAMPLGAPPQATAPQGMLAAVWDWIADLFPGGGGQEPASAWDNAGCEMDPDGLPQILATPSTSSNSTAAEVDGMDPNGSL